MVIQMAKTIHMYRILILLLLLTSCFQQNKEIEAPSFSSEETNISRKYHQGKLQAEYELKDGIKNGTGKCYYENGKLSTTCNYTNGLKEGVEKKFYFDGKLYRTREFSNGKMNGTEKRFYENGVLMTEMEYKNGMPSTGLKEYTNTGDLIKNYPEITYEIIYDRDYPGQKLLVFYFSDKNSKVSYYEGSLLEGKYFNTNADPCGSKNGIGEIGLYNNFKGNITVSAKYIR